MGWMGEERRISRRRQATTIGLVALILGFAGLAASAERAGAYVYWSALGGFGEGELGRADLDGSHIDRRFVRRTIGPAAVAVDDRHVYWVNSDSDSIGRSRIDGSHPDQRFITDAGVASDVTVDGGYVYWSSAGDLGETAAIARARLDGSAVERGFIPLTDGRYAAPGELDVRRNFIYWTNKFPQYTVARARTDGSDLDVRFISGGLQNPYGLAVGREHVYFTNHRTHSIARADIDGSNLEIEFVPDIGTPSSIAISRRFLYWAGGLGPIVRSRLNGSHVRPLIRTGRIRADSVAVDGRGPR
jgi:virginiamycin B lyase